MSLDELKTEARTLFLTGVRAADPKAAVQRALTDAPLATNDGQLYIIAIGKAACDMMERALCHVPAGQAFQAIAVTNYENAREITGARVLAAGHPLPDQNGLTAGAEVMKLLRDTTEGDLVLCLISGGGSALLPTPREGLTLAEKINVNKLLLASGLDIHQMNRIRQQLSVLKGGGLAAMAAPAEVRGLIISDVVGDDLEIIASGPTATVNNNPDDIVRMLKARQLWDKLPETAQFLLRTPKEASPHASDNQLICTNAMSLQAIAAAAPDMHPVIVEEPLVGDVADAARRVISQISTLSPNGPQLLIWGGETTVNLTGSGKGGRNQELSLRVANLAQDLPGDWVFLSGGTDGRDGPTDAAGGIVTSQTITQARRAGIDIEAALRANDSYRVLEASDALLKTGATGTNVADIQIFLRHA